MRLKTTLEQWHTLKAINEAGSIQAAAVQMNKSHTTLIYSVKKLEDQLGVTLLEVVSKKACLTGEGKTLLRHANPMLDQAKGLEDISAQLLKGVESEIQVTVDHLFDKEILYRALSEFVESYQMTSVQVLETSLTSTEEAVVGRLSDVAIITLPVTNFPAEALGVVTMIPVVSSAHDLASRGPLTMGELIGETQIVLRDLGGEESSSARETRNVGWLKAKRRITVDTFELALQGVKNGLGFTRIPEYLYHQHQDALTKLDIPGASRYQVPMHITLPGGAESGPGAQHLHQLILSHSKQIC